MSIMRIVAASIVLARRALRRPPGPSASTRKRLLSFDKACTSLPLLIYSRGLVQRSKDMPPSAELHKQASEGMCPMPS
jgi:hypothetical protein